MSFIKKIQLFVAKAIERQQRKPEKTRQKIFLGGVVFTAILLIFFWIWQLKVNVLQAEVKGLPKPGIEIEGLQNFDGLVDKLKNISDENLEEIEKLKERETDAKQ